MQFVSIMGAYQTVLNVYFLHFAIFFAIMFMPKHKLKEFEIMYVKSGIEFNQEAEQLTILLNKALWELAWYGHFLVGTLVLFGTYLKKFSILISKILCKVRH
jgi:hypothetical protein